MSLSLIDCLHSWRINWNALLLIFACFHFIPSTIYVCKCFLSRSLVCFSQPVCCLFGSRIPIFFLKETRAKKRSIDVTIKHFFLNIFYDFNLTYLFFFRNGICLPNPNKSNCLMIQRVNFLRNWWTCIDFILLLH